MQTTDAHPNLTPRPYRKILSRIGFLTAGLLLGAGLMRWYDAADTEEHQVLAAYGQQHRSGPWGEIYSTPFSISAPEELLPLRKLEESGTRWLFPNMHYSEVERLLEATGLPRSLVAELTEPGVLEQTPSGMEMKPSAKTLMALPAGPRKKLYQAVLEHPMNRGQIIFIHKDTLGDRFGRTHGGEHTLMLFKQLCCEHGDYLVFSGLSAVLEQLPTYEEKRDFMRGLTSQRTLTLRVHIKPGEDTSDLANYWGKGMKGTDVRTIFESIAATPTGGMLGVINMLPPLPSSQMFLYPMPDNPLNGPAPIRDCHWTSFNFFNDVAEPELGNQDFYMQKLKEEYIPAAGDPRYGDIALFTKPSGAIVHSAVYIADDIFYTKNGATFTYPWMLETLPDLIKQYSFQVEPGEKLVVSYFRNKNM
ncbi:hypothetical protein [Prosthecobacter vanneervenii]|uniref:Uncharacterized protein n=1 Tax=Prosthecobacter vanneervenii TaxID=48466 RepID=A0A7W7YG39_9BACT|nr:hypothetical protein [Prosthecobacter vanneervenii]MBB5035220.1 hypothetical protein [Prosthecobacter vanneervenii]